MIGQALLWGKGRASFANFRSPDIARCQAGLRSLSATLEMTGFETEFAGPTVIGETHPMKGPAIGMAIRRTVRGLAFEPVIS